jgi:mono/diheme cytochrome c family protein
MKRVFKWTGRIIGGIIAFLLLAAGVVYAVSEIRINSTYERKPEKISISSDPMTLERGRHLSRAIAKCVDCHGEDFGGKLVIDDPMVGHVPAPNITMGKGSVVRDYTDADWVRTIRYGVRPNGKPLVVMPSQEYWHHDDEELGAIIAYVKSMPPVDRDMGDKSLGLAIRALYLAGQVPLPAEVIDISQKRVPAPPVGATVEYGKHLSITGGCIGCHGPTLSGGKVPGAPPDWPAARNLTPDDTSGLGRWSEEDFFRALRTGKRPDGTDLNPMMPWKYTATMKDDEIRALWLYLRTLEAKPMGSR